MFFADRIQTLRPSDRVLEVGPGACPHPQADVFLEKQFLSAEEAFGQRGRTSELSTDKPVITYDGGKFPFRDNEFDYVICSHVLEHVENIEEFCGELTRVAKRGYIEFPTVYYDYLYDIPEHVMLLFWQNGILHYMPKAESGIKEFRNLTSFLFYTLQCGYDTLIRPYMPLFFQGFEWSDSLTLRKAENISELSWTLIIAEKPVEPESGSELAVLVFSKDRAMQLDALLASLQLHCHDPQFLRIQVLYTCSTDRYRAQYRELAAAHNQVSFVAETDFRAQVQSALKPADKILFLVDDTLLVRDFSSQQLIKLLDEHSEVAGISLRLGRNTAYCYPLERFQTIPPFESLGNGFLRYEWLLAEADFGYPLEISSSCYRAKDILQVLDGCSFKNPNELEGALAANARNALIPQKRLLLCPEHSLAFSYPVNVVQTACPNRHEPSLGCTTEFLADLFDQGRRIDVKAYSNFLPNACHQPVELIFK